MARFLQDIVSFIIFAVLCISMLANCTDDEKVTDEMIVADRSAKSYVFKQVQDYIQIVENKEKTREKRNAIRFWFAHWTGGIVPFRISSTFSESQRRVILQSMKHWEDYTCIRFRPRMNSDIYSLIFRPGADCSSFVGRNPRFYQPQAVNLGAGCVVLPVVLHEIGHALGFYHEQSREDRDNYIRVINSNIKPGFQSQFDRRTSGQATTLNLGYDYASIMHYGPTFFARRGTSAIVANNPNIPIGGAQELSPLDVAKANRLYNCSTKTRPPPSIILPAKSVVTLPDGISCGNVTKVTGPGRIMSPQFPSHVLNEECAFVFEAAEGYGFSISFPQFSLDPTTDCTEDYVQIYRGSSASSSDLIRYGGFTEGRICNRQNSRRTFNASDKIVTVYYRTNGRNIRSDVRGLQIAYDLRDIDECQNSRLTGHCHSCTNLPGSFQCNCRDGYYHSYAATTCYDVNECAFGNGGCSDTCTNFGGSYRCSCNNGLFLQADGLSCGPTPPYSIPENTTPGTIIPKHQPSIIQATTMPPPVTTPPRPICGGLITESSGVLNTPNWPLTYPLNFACIWNIVLNDPNAIIEINFDNDFGIGGQMPVCPKDYLTLFDRPENTESRRFGPYCHLTRPDPIRTTSNMLTVVFLSRSSHGPTRHGFRAQYKSITLVPPTPTSPPATTSAPITTSPPSTTSTPNVQLPQCGGGLRKLTSMRGSLQTLDWPNSPYPLNTVCDWDIECPVGTKINIQFEDSFRIAGRMPVCTKDKLTISGCEGSSNGHYCHLEVPAPISTSCNAVHIRFQAGSQRGVTRTGFKLSYRCFNSQ